MYYITVTFFLFRIFPVSFGDQAEPKNKDVVAQIDPTKRCLVVQYEDKHPEKLKVSRESCSATKQVLCKLGKCNVNPTFFSGIRFMIFHSFQWPWYNIGAKAHIYLYYVLQFDNNLMLYGEYTTYRSIHTSSKILFSSVIVVSVLFIVYKFTQ